MPPVPRPSGPRASLTAAAAIIACAQWLAAKPALAQTTDTASPVGARVAVGGEITATVGPHDPEYFNYTDYSHSALRIFTGSLGAAWNLAAPLSIVGEVRLENADSFRVSALYVRYRPRPSWPVDLQVGRIPPVFGAFSRYRYGSDNPLVSLPLAYQYLTTLRTDQVPPTSDTLLRRRGSGWRVSYTTSTEDGPYQVPESAYDTGRPLVSVSRWDTGIQAHAATSRLDATVAVTQGSLSRPRVQDDNDGKQLVGRVVWRPVPACALGVSAARAEFLARVAADDLPAAAGDGPWTQRGLGVDAELSGGHWRVRAELLHSAWREPVVAAPEIDSPLEAFSGTVEVLYRAWPRVEIAARGDRLTFSRIRGYYAPEGTRPTPWDANVSRVEAGASYRITRQARLKLVYQHDWRDTTPGTDAGYPAAQFSYWF